MSYSEPHICARPRDGPWSWGGPQGDTAHTAGILILGCTHVTVRRSPVLRDPMAMKGDGLLTGAASTLGKRMPKRELGIGGSPKSPGLYRCAPQWLRSGSKGKCTGFLAGVRLRGREPNVGQGRMHSEPGLWTACLLPPLQMSGLTLSEALYAPYVCDEHILDAPFYRNSARCCLLNHRRNRVGEWGLLRLRHSNLLSGICQDSPAPGP